MAAALLVGLLLSAVVTAKARHTRQTVLAQQKLAAVGAARQLLMEWFSSPEDTPPPGGGAGTAVAGVWTLNWQINTVSHADVDTLGGDVVELVIRSVDSAEEPLVSVQFVIPDAESDAATESRP